MEIAYFKMLNIRFKISDAQYQIQKLQGVLSASARLIFSMPRYWHITPLLLDVHCLPVNQPIAFKILLLVYKVLHQLAPSYLVELI